VFDGINAPKLFHAKTSGYSQPLKGIDYKQELNSSETSSANVEKWRRAESGCKRSDIIEKQVTRRDIYFLFLTHLFFGMTTP
jgi:hypothetical protein